MSFAGIDYGSKLAGTTVLALIEANSPVSFFQSQKKKNADEFLEEIVLSHTIDTLFLDAPLSLPGVFISPKKYNDFFYRVADRETSAMSPMFLGGLTARAMRLKQLFEKQEIKVHEVYPSIWAKRFKLKEIDYKGKKASIIEVANFLHEKIPIPFDVDHLSSWHHIDALLAAYSGLRFTQKIHETIGDPEEGIIIV